MSAPHIDVEGLISEISEMDEDALAHALRRAHAESSESRDPIAAFGAFNQHSSSPW